MIPLFPFVHLRLLICFLTYKLVCIFKEFYKRNYTAYTFLSGFFHSANTVWDSTMLLHVSLVYSFLLLSTISLYGNTTLCFVIYLLMDICFQLLTIQIKLLKIFRYKFLISLMMLSIFSSPYLPSIYHLWWSICSNFFLLFLKLVYLLIIEL